MILVCKLVLIMIWKEKYQDLGRYLTHNVHNSGVTALPLSYMYMYQALAWKQGGGELGIRIRVLLVPIYRIFSLLGAFRL